MSPNRLEDKCRACWLLSGSPSAPGSQGHSSGVNVSLPLGCRSSCTLVLSPRHDRWKKGEQKASAKSLAFTCRPSRCEFVFTRVFFEQSRQVHSLVVSLAKTHICSGSSGSPGKLHLCPFQALQFSPHSQCWKPHRRIFSCK